MMDLNIKCKSTQLLGKKREENLWDVELGKQKVLRNHTQKSTMHRRKKNC